MQHTTNKILVITHCAQRGRVGVLGDIINRLGYEMVAVNGCIGDDYPSDLSPYTAAIVLGGSMSVYQHPDLPWMRDELKWIEKKLLPSGKPVLGICLGCQMLSHVYGGDVRQGEKGRSLGFKQVKLLVNDDPVFGNEIADFPLLKWHGDTYTLPQSAVQLAEGILYPQQAARFSRNVYGVQFHPETPLQQLHHWIEEDRRGGFDLSAMQEFHSLMAQAQIDLPKSHAWLESFLGRLIKR